MKFNITFRKQRNSWTNLNSRRLYIYIVLRNDDPAQGKKKSHTTKRGTLKSVRWLRAALILRRNSSAHCVRAKIAIIYNFRSRYTFLSIYIYIYRAAHRVQWIFHDTPNFLSPTNNCFPESTLIRHQQFSAFIYFYDNNQ